MEIEYVLIADYAEIAGGKLYLMGGGWDTYRATETPVQLRMAVALGLRIGWEETNQAVPVTVVVEHEDGAVIARIDGSVNVGRPVHLPPGSSQLSQLAVNLALTLQQMGGFRVRVTGGVAAIPVEHTLPFRVVKA